MHPQPEVVQETPYRFNTAAALAAPTACEPNRGGTAGSLCSSTTGSTRRPAPRVTIAREVNAHDFLARRLARCEARAQLLPNIVAVDFYRQGEVFDTVARLNAKPG